MHSTEVAPVQVIPDIVYRLATERSPEINRILKKMLIVVVPAANPDGSHLVTDFFNETAGTYYTRTYPDLYHPYTGHDDNRDWLFFTQQSRKLRIGVFKKYKPVVEHILHQAGATNPRMWVPPYNDGVCATRDALRCSPRTRSAWTSSAGSSPRTRRASSSVTPTGSWRRRTSPSFETFMGSALVAVRGRVA